MSVEQAVQQLVDDLVGAWNSRNWGSFSRLFAENADYITGAGVRLAGRGAIHEAMSERAGNATDSGPVSIVTESIKTLGPDAAVILCSWRMIPGHEAHADAPGRMGLLTIVTRRIGDGWRIMVLQNTDRTP